ncbi:hypothetical protein JCM10212_000733 [Sporobolomyces blumeae]
MSTRSFKPLLADALDSLLSLRATSTRHSLALAQIEAVLAPLALDPNPVLLDAFLTSQDSVDRNVTAGLLEWLGRTLVRLDSLRGQDAEQARDNVIKCLGLVQGLLLLHRRSQRLFARKASLEYLVAVLDLARPSSVSTPLASPRSTPLPSPVLFPTSPAFHHDVEPHYLPPPESGSASTGQHLAIAALDTLLCALVDRPKNMRAFEEMGGLASIVRVLKDKGAAQPVRIKVIELLYYYLLPETNLAASTSTVSSGPRSTYSADSYPSSTESTTNLSSRAFTSSELPGMLADAAQEFVPQTPRKPRAPAAQPTPTRTRSAHSSDGFDPNWTGGPPRPSTSTSSSSSREQSPTRTPQPRPRGLRHKRSQSLLHFPTHAAPSPNPSPRKLAQSVSAPSSDSESTPRPKFVRTARNPLDPIPASPDPARPKPHHRRTQSTSAAASPARPSLDPSTVMSPRPTRTAATPALPAASNRRTSDRDKETAMLPPPVPLARSSSTKTPASSHRRTSSSASSSTTTVPPSPRTSSRSTPSTPRSTSQPNPTTTPSTSAALDPATVPALPRPPSARARHLRTEDEKKELLRKVMPNVDALEQRFRMMGLGTG